MTDQDLLKRYVDHQDHDAFRVLVDRHAGMVYGVALRRTLEPVLAEEVAQTVFVQFAKKAASLNQPGRLAGWLHRSALLESAHLLRKRRREVARQQRLKEEMEWSHGDQHPNEIAVVIDEALGELPPRDRELVLAKYYEGLTYREIAVRRAQGEAATRKQGSRALAKLERLLCRKGLVMTSVALGVGLGEVLKASAPVGLSDVIEGRVAELAAGKGVALTGALASTLGSSWGLALIAAAMALVPWTQGWGRRATGANAMMAADDYFTILGVRKSPGEVLRHQLPTIDQILAAQGTERIELLVPWLARASSEDLAEMGQALKRGVSSYANESTIKLFLSLYLQRWLAVDSAGALAFAEELRKPKGRLRSVLAEENLFAWWAQSHPEQAWVEARSRSVQLAGKVIARIQEEDPWQAYELVQNLSLEEGSIAVSWDDLVARLAEVDVEGALMVARKMQDPVSKRESLNAVIQHYARQDPEAAMKIAKDSEESDRAHLMAVVLGEWLVQDWQTAWSNVAELPSGLLRLRLTRQAAMRRMEQAEDGAEAWAGSLGDAAMKRAAWSGLAIAFSRIDAQRAQGAFEKLGWDLTETEPIRVFKGAGSSSFWGPGEDSLKQAAKAVAMRFAQDDFAKAFEFTGSFNRSPRASGLHEIEHELARRWISKDPDGMVRYIEGSDNAQTRAFLIGRYVDQVSDPVAALPWAKSLGGEAAGGATMGLFSRMSAIDFDLVIEQLPAVEDLDVKTQAWVVGSIIDLPSQRPQVEQLSRVKDWLDQQPDTDVVANGYRPLINRWASQDMDAAVSIVEQLEPGPVREGAVGGILGVVGNESPMKHEVVLQWIGQAESERTQQFWLKALAKDWLAKDPDTAREVIPKAGLKKDVWEMLLSRQQINERREQ